MHREGRLPRHPEWREQQSWGSRPAGRHIAACSGCTPGQPRQVKLLKPVSGPRTLSAPGSSKISQVQISIGPLHPVLTVLLLLRQANRPRIMQELVGIASKTHAPISFLGIEVNGRRRWDLR